MKKFILPLILVGLLIGQISLAQSGDVFGLPADANYCQKDSDCIFLTNCLLNASVNKKYKELLLDRWKSWEEKSKGWTCGAPLRYEYKEIPICRNNKCTWSSVPNESNPFLNLSLYIAGWAVIYWPITILLIFILGVSIGVIILKLHKNTKRKRVDK